MPDARPEPVTVAIVGAGERGFNAYGRWCLEHPEEARVVAIAEPEPARRRRMAAEHAIDKRHVFRGWRQLAAAGRQAEALIVATPDREHVGPALAALEAGYHILLEKPIAPTLDEVRTVGTTAARLAGSITVAHVLRYTPFFSALRRILDSGWIGDLITIHHAENVGYWHFAHSFVRGTWRNERLASPMLLAKACHDLDLLRWLAGDRCTAVASFGGLHHFRPERAPAGSTARCTDGCPAAPDCPFDAVRFYVERLAGETGWPVSAITDDPSREGRLAALQTGPYGRCVYRCDNDVADHQVVALEFANGVRATLAVNGLTADNTRTIKLVGSRGEVRGRLDTGEIEVRRFLPAAGGPHPSGGAWNRDAIGRAALPGDQREVISVAPPPATLTDLDGLVARNGHGGGDDGLMRDFIARVRSLRQGDPGVVQESRTALAVSLESHLMAFAAETARHTRTVVEL